MVELTIRVSPPTLPLSREELRQALKMGSGRALQHLKNHGISGAKSAIIDACLSEPQLEYYDSESYTPWIVDIVVDAGLAERVIAEIVRAESDQESSANSGNLDHRRDILLALARRSVPRAGATLYSLLTIYRDSRDVVDDEVVGGSQIVELDGIDGLLFVAGQIGQWMASTTDFDPDEHDCGLWALHESIGAETGRDALSKAAGEDLHIARYVRHLKQLVSPSPARRARELELRSIGASEVISLVQSASDGELYRLSGWGRYANPAALDSVFEAMLLETDTTRLKNYLRAFGILGVPRLDDRLLDWLAPSGNLVHEAVQALAPLSDPRLRDFALMRLAPPRCDARYLALLVHNYEPGDHITIEDALLSGDSDQEHSAAYDALSIYEANPVPEATDSLCFIYDRTTCENCRLRALELLTKVGSIPDWMRAEATFDYSADIRELVTG